MASSLNGSTLEAERIEPGKTRSKLEWALDAASRGFAVFPTCWTDEAGSCSCENAQCLTPGKHPLKNSHGHLDATRDVKQITDWWTTNPNSNIGLYPGQDHVVLDLDRKGKKDGLERLAQYLDWDPLDVLTATYTVRTPTGGYHLYFSTLEPARSRVDVLGLAGVDVRGVNGYVLAPGSVIAKRVYEHAFGPNDTPSPLPETLKALLKAPNTRKKSSIAEPARGWDTDEAVSIARGLLQHRKPAVWGEGGDIWTYQTACCLRDCGVSEEKAAELMIEAPQAEGETEALSWNERCEPPWDLDDLRVKVANAYKYAQNAPGERLEHGFDHISELPEIFLRPPIRTTLEVLDEALARAADQKGAVSEPAIFRQSSRLVVIDEAVGELLCDDNGKTCEIRRSRGAPILTTAHPERLRLIASEHARFFKWNEKFGAWTLTDCPLPAARSYLAKGEWAVPILEGIAECPTLRLDGSIVQEQGYDIESGLVLRFKNCFPPIPDKPSRQQAEAALATLRRPVRCIEFADQVDQDVFVAAVLTGVVRYAIDIAPLFAFSASKAGSGKTIMAQAAAEIVSGHGSTMMTLTSSDQENEKQLDAALLKGDRVIVFDNCDRPICGNALCQVITNPTRNARVLGESRNVLVSTRILLIATGNNLRAQGDMAKRAVLSYNDPATEFPENRRFDFDLLAEVRVDRPALVTAALALARGYLAAGSPPLKVEPTRFPQWDRLVRFPIIWAGGCDIAQNMKAVLEDDPDRLAIGAVLETWVNCYGSREKRLSEVTSDLCGFQLDVTKQALKDSLREALDARPGAGIEAKQLGEWLAGRENRVVNGLKFQKSTGMTGGSRRWRVVQAHEDV